MESLKYIGATVAVVVAALVTLGTPAAHPEPLEGGGLAGCTVQTSSIVHDGLLELVGGTAGCTDGVTLTCGVRDLATRALIASSSTDGPPIRVTVSVKAGDHLVGCEATAPPADGAFTRTVLDEETTVITVE